MPVFYEHRSYSVMACPSCQREVDLYGFVVGAWCGPCDRVLKIAELRTWKRGRLVPAPASSPPTSSGSAGSPTSSAAPTSAAVGSAPSSATGSGHRDDAARSPPRNP